MNLGWGVPFLWAGIWAAITVPWVRSVMAKERKSWEEDTAIVGDAPAALAPRLTEKTSEVSTLRDSVAARPDEDVNGEKKTTTPEGGEGPSRLSGGTTV
jgi:hypothetical protein